MQECQVSNFYPKWVDLNEGKEDICLVDVRSLEEYNQCYIEGVKHIRAQRRFFRSWQGGMKGVKWFMN